MAETLRLSLCGDVDTPATWWVAVVDGWWDALIAPVHPLMCGFPSLIHSALYRFGQPASHLHCLLIQGDNFTRTPTK